jgi:hypothetical protein
MKLLQRRRCLLVATALLATRNAHAQIDNTRTEAPPMVDKKNKLDDAMIDADPPRFDPVPKRPDTPTPGKPGDFAFLDGRWRISHLKRSATGWDRFEGEARCWSILGGIGSVEELLIPARDFNGLGLRMLDVEKRQWSDHWVNAKSGVVSTPGQLGSFEGGVGLFASTYEDGGKTMHSMGIWDRIAPGQCRWRQVYSGDGGKTWEHDWVMHWRRVD